MTGGAGRMRPSSEHRSRVGLPHPLARSRLVRPRQLLGLPELPRRRFGFPSQHPRSLPRGAERTGRSWPRIERKLPPTALRRVSVAIGALPIARLFTQ